MQKPHKTEVLGKVTNEHAERGEIRIVHPQIRMKENETRDEQTQLRQTWSMVSPPPLSQRESQTPQGPERYYT